MQACFEEALISHCAPTLAGHKCGSLFSWRKTYGRDLAQDVAAVNRLLQPKGVRIRLLKYCPAGALVYVYRPSMLKKRLADPDIRAFLKAQGYESLLPADALAALARRIHCGREFPHEIGIFLDYPLEDVIGFISHHGAKFRCLGCWKAYTDEEKAERTFALYRKCRLVYLNCYHNKGYGVTRLTVAA